jgi:hypothetical protein
MSPELAARLERLNGKQRSLLRQTIETLGDAANDLSEHDFHTLLDELAGIPDTVLVWHVLEVSHSVSERRRILDPILGERAADADVLGIEIAVTALPAYVLQLINDRQRRIDRLVAEAMARDPDANPYGIQLQIEDQEADRHALRP